MSVSPDRKPRPSVLPARLTVPTALGDVAVHRHGAPEVSEPPEPPELPDSVKRLDSWHPSLGPPLGPPAPPGPGRPALLLLHANPGDSRDFAAILPALAETHQILAVDWPGYGGSTVTDPERVTADSLVAVAERVLDALAERGVRRMSVIGNSVGGYVACRLAERRPEAISGLVLVDPGGFTKPSALTRFICRHVMGRPGAARWLAAPLARTYLGRLSTGSARATYARVRRVRHDPQRLAVHCSVWRSFADPAVDLCATAADLAVPVLLIWGRRDPIVPAFRDGRRARRALPDAASAVLPTGHEPFNERPELFLSHVRPFLTGLPARYGSSKGTTAAAD